MSTRFWLFSATTFGVAVVAGLRLGAYITSQPASAARSYDIAETSDQAALVSTGSDALDTAPKVIHCRGCGPTLAERRMAADIAGMDADGMITGTSDPVTRDYLAEEPREAVAIAEPSPGHRLPPDVERFVASPEAAAPPVSRTLPVAAIPTVGTQP